jgi:DNA-binding PadR family transcriptional regulator
MDLRPQRLHGRIVGALQLADMSLYQLKRVLSETRENVRTALYELRRDGYVVGKREPHSNIVYSLTSTTKE